MQIAEKRCMNRLKIGEPCAFFLLYSRYTWRGEDYANNKRPLHPSVQQFKEFVNHHPKMVHEVRSGHKTWQQFYEEWYLLGEEDPIWATYRPDGAPAFSSVKENKKKKIIELKRKKLLM